MFTVRYGLVLKQLMLDTDFNHGFSSVLTANAEMTPKIPSGYCVLLLQPSRFKLSKLIPCLERTQSERQLHL